MVEKYDKLYSFLDKANIAEDLDEELIGTIGQRCLRDFQIDKESRADWERLNENGMKLAKQFFEEKNSPWPKAANVKYPLITTASIQFAARAYPELIQGDNVVKAKIVGKDPEGLKAARAARVKDHMNYQLLEEMEGWEEGADKLLHGLPIAGTWFKKTYFDGSKGINVSESLSPDVVVVNNKAATIETARSISHTFTKHANQIKEYIAAKTWLDFDPVGLGQSADSDEDPPYEFIEQHRFWDLDEDGYEEPYIVTLHRESGKVVRILCRLADLGITVAPDGELLASLPLGNPGMLVADL